VFINWSPLKIFQGFFQYPATFFTVISKDQSFSSCREGDTPREETIV
jgi:hypothetical protein